MALCLVDGRHTRSGVLKGLATARSALESMIAADVRVDLEGKRRLSRFGPDGKPTPPGTGPRAEQASACRPFARWAVRHLSGMRCREGSGR